MRQADRPAPPASRVEFDVIVIGAGGSGLAAAASAAQAGARVLVLERGERVGGTTAMAVGSISAARTRLQRQAGISDDFDAFVEDMNAFTADLLAHDNAPLRRMLAEQAGITVDWLASQGVAFAGPYAEPPHRTPRMHNTIPGPGAIIARLLRTCQRHAAQVQTGVTVQRLLLNAQGAALGVEYLHGGSVCQAMARGGVVLASGDFSGNALMRHAHLPTPAARATPINAGNLGDGFRLAQDAGAVPVHMDKIFGPQLRFSRSQHRGLNDVMPSWPWLAWLSAKVFMHAPAWMLQPLVKSLLIANMSPSDALFKCGAVLVDKAGVALDSTRPAVSIALTAERAGYIVMRASAADQFRAQPYFISTAPGIAYAYLGDYERGRPDIVHYAADLAGLAQALGMPSDAALRLAVGQSLGDDGDDGGPWVALGPVHAMLTTTEGAVKVDAQCRVLNLQGQVVPGLYAVGCMGQGGLLLRGHGLHLAWAFTSGRVAGWHAAQQRSGG
jgi:fumarate reductase flavoprotein subunit